MIHGFCYLLSLHNSIGGIFAFAIMRNSTNFVERDAISYILGIYP